MTELKLPENPARRNVYLVTLPGGVTRETTACSIEHAYTMVAEKEGWENTVYGKWLDDEMRNGYPGVEIVREGILPEQRSMIAYLSKFHARFSGRREGETVAEAEKRIRNAINARLKSGRMDRRSLGRYFQEAEKKAHAIERERHKQTELACESGPVDTDTVTGTGWKPHSLRTGSGEDFEQLSLFRYRQGVHQA